MIDLHLALLRSTAVGWGSGTAGRHHGAGDRHYPEPVLWFTVWAILVVGTLVGAFFLLRHVYRSAKGLLRAFEEAADTFSTLADRAEALADSATTPAPVDLLDPGPARARLAEVRTARMRRRARRSETHAAAYRRWQSFAR